MACEIRVREVASQPIVSIRAIVQTPELVQFFDEACNEMRTYLTRVGVRAVGPARSLLAQRTGQIPDNFDIVYPESARK